MSNIIIYILFVSFCCSLLELTQVLIQASTSFQHDLVLPLSSLLSTLHIT